MVITSEEILSRISTWPISVGKINLTFPALTFLSNCKLSKISGDFNLLSKVDGKAAFLMRSSCLSVFPSSCLVVVVELTKMDGAKKLN